MSDIGHDSFHSEVVARGFGEFGGIDAEVDECGGGVGYGADFEADGSWVGLNELAYRDPDFADMRGVHPSMEKDTQGVLVGLVGELGPRTTFDQMVHSGEGEDTAYIGGAVCDAKGAVAALLLAGGLEDEAEDSRSDVGYILKVTGDVGGLVIDLSAHGEFELCTSHGV